jgi:hypothetical protein
VAFVATLILARASNPGEASPASTSDVPAAVEDDDQDDGLGFGSASIGPSGSEAPSVGTHAS